MAQGYQYGNRNAVVNSDKLEHYRIEIRKLKQINKVQQQSYERKILMLQKQIRSNLKSKQFSLDPSQTSNNELLKRDKQINRLAQQNERLKRQNYRNPDRQLLKKRDLFQSMADKDQQILKLKKVIHDLQNKYDGKYFNQNKMKKDYQILYKQNQKLRKQIQLNMDKKQQTKQQINPQILELVKYKKHNQLLQRQNQHLKGQLKNIVQQKGSYIRKSQPPLGQNTQIQALKKQLKQSSQKNRQIYMQNQILEQQNKQLNKQNRYLSEELKRYQKQNIKQQKCESQKKSQPQLYLSNRQTKPIYDRSRISQIQSSKMSQIQERNKQYKLIQSEFEQQKQRKRIFSQQQKKQDLKLTKKKKGLYQQFNLAQVLKNTNKQSQ